MITKNVFGLIAVIFSLLIIFNIFNSIMNSTNLNSQIKILNDITNNVESICYSSAQKMGYPLKLKTLEEDYSLKISSNNSVCITMSDNSIKCERFKCNLEPNNQIIMQNRKDNFSTNLYNVCFLEKKNSNLININCSKEYIY